MFAINLQHETHTKRYFISALGDSGWEVCFEEDRELKQRAYYRDWHRVERALAEFQREIVALTGRGWSITAARGAAVQSTNL